MSSSVLAQLNRPARALDQLDRADGHLLRADRGWLMPDGVHVEKDGGIGGAGKVDWESKSDQQKQSNVHVWRRVKILDPSCRGQVMTRFTHDFCSRGCLLLLQCTLTVEYVRIDKEEGKRAIPFFGRVVMKRFAPCLALAAAVFGTGPVDSVEVIINVAFGNRTTYSMIGISSDDPMQAGEVGTGTAAPLEYTGSTWNDNDSSGSDLLDSDGNATAVGFSTTQFKDNPGDWGGPGILQFLGAGLHADPGYGGPPWQPDPGTVPTLTISGLDDGKTYDLIVVMRDGRDGCINQYNLGGTVDWADPNHPVFDGGTTLVASNPAAQGATWVEGENYVKFTGLTPVDGTIEVRIITLSGRNTMNGFQLVALEEPTQAPLPPTNLVATGGNKQVSLAWSAPVPGPQPMPSQYLVFRGTTKIDDVMAPTTTYVDDDPLLVPGTQYCYTVKSKAGNQTSGPSNESCGTTTEATPVFHRGDANADGTINITDGIFVLNFLFLGGPTPTCAEAANPNDDETINITDGIYILNFLFLGGPSPTAPGPADLPCGPDQAGTNLGCESYGGC